MMWMCACTSQIAELPCVGSYAGMHSDQWAGLVEPLRRDYDGGWYIVVMCIGQLDT